MVRGEVFAISRTRTQRCHAQYIGQEAEALAGPRENHRAAAGEALRFFVNMRTQRLVNFVLNQAVRPGDAHGIRFVVAGRHTEQQGKPAVGLFLVLAARLDFDFRAIRQADILHAAGSYAQCTITRSGVG